MHDLPEFVSLDRLTDHTPVLAVYDEYPSDMDDTPPHGILRPSQAHEAYRIVEVTVGRTTFGRVQRIIRSAVPNT